VQGCLAPETKGGCMKKCMVFAIMVCSLFFSALADAKEPIHIGLSAPMTGQYAGYGDRFKKAIDLAIETINKAGGIDRRPVEVIVRDSQGDPKLAKRIARKFGEDKRILAEIGDFTSTCSMAAAPIYQRAEMVQLSPTASHPSFAPGSPYSFGISGTAKGSFNVIMAQLAVKRLGKTRIAVLYINNDWGTSAQKFFVEEIKRLGGEITAIVPYFEGTTDFTPAIEKLRSAHPEVLYLCLMDKDGALVSRQRKKFGWDDVTIMGGPALYSPKLLEIAGDAAEGVYTSCIFFTKAPRSAIQEFVKRYEEEYKRLPNSFDAAAYDSMIMLARAIENAGTDRKAIRDELANMKNFQGLTGKMTFTEHGDVVKDYFILQVKNGEFVLYSEK